MSITVIEKPANLDGELAVTITNEDNQRVHIHPWDRPDNTRPREVFIAVGELEESGDAVTDEHGDTTDFGCEIVNRDDFIEALLAVFPEITRA